MHSSRVGKPAYRRAAAVLLGCALSLSAYQAAPEQKGSIEGRVLNAVSGEAVRKVTVTLTQTRGKEKPVTALTDENGRFAFAGLDAGGYRLSGERNGFVKQEYGARLNPDSGAVLAVRAGQGVKDLPFKLAPAAVISGRVIDQDGEPMPNLLVTVLSRHYVAGRRQWQQAGAAQSNDRGEFRIGGLRAGRYLVNAHDLNIGIGLAGTTKGPLPEKPEQSYASTYFANATEMARAVPVEVQMGEDHRGADIQMAKTATVRVRGKAVGVPDGKQLVVILARKGSAGAASAPGAIGIVQPADATFELRNVTPGSYYLAATSTTDAGGPLAGAMPIEVADQHMDGVEFQLGGGSDVSGSVTVLGGKPGAAKNISVMLQLVDMDLPGAPNTLVADDGSFTLRNVLAGKYRVRVGGTFDGTYVKSVKLGGQEVDDAGVDFGAGGGKLAIVVSGAGAQVEGTVVRADGQPQSGALVTLIPDSGRDSYYRTATSDHDGTFTLKGVAPGKYKVMAWEDLEPGAYQDAEFVKPFEGSAEKLSLEENGKSKVTLKAIPFEKVAGGAHE